MEVRGQGCAEMGGSEWGRGWTVVGCMGEKVTGNTPGRSDGIHEEGGRAW